MFQTKTRVNFILRRVYLKLVFLFLALFIGSCLLAQSAPGDSSFFTRSLDTLQSLYRNTVRINRHIYTGNEYFQYGLRVKGHPYFESDSLANGIVSYGGVLYRDVPMHYDMLYDDIVVKDYSASFPIKLISPKIEYFIVFGHRFVHFSPDSTESGQKTPGFFDLIFDDTIVQVYVKRQKRLEMPLDISDSTPVYRQYDTYYLSFQGQAYKIKDIREAIKVLKDRKDDLKKFARAKGIRTRDINDESVKMIIAYYGSLKK